VGDGGGEDSPRTEAARVAVAMRLSLGGSGQAAVGLHRSFITKVEAKYGKVVRVKALVEELLAFCHGNVVGGNKGVTQSQEIHNIAGGVDFMSLAPL